MNDSLVLPDLDAALAERIASDYGRNPHTQDTSVSLAEANAIARCVAGFKLERTLEIGLAHAGSSAAIIAAKRHAGFQTKHVALDPYQRSHSESRGLEVLQALGYADDLDYREEFSERYLPASTEVFDFILVDGGHGLGQAMVDAFFSDRLLRIGGFMAVDDIYLKTTAQSLRYLIDECGYRVINGAPIKPLRALRHGARLGYDYARMVAPSVDGLAILQKTRDYRGGY